MPRRQVDSCAAADVIVAAPLSAVASVRDTRSRSRSMDGYVLAADKVPARQELKPSYQSNWSLLRPEQMVWCLAGHGADLQEAALCAIGEPAQESHKRLVKVQSQTASNRKSASLQKVVVFLLLKARICAGGGGPGKSR